MQDECCNVFCVLCCRAVARCAVVLGAAATDVRTDGPKLKNSLGKYITIINHPTHVDMDIIVPTQDGWLHVRIRTHLFYYVI